MWHNGVSSGGFEGGRGVGMTTEIVSLSTTGTRPNFDIENSN
jgi:hypothetical protein